MHNTLRRGAARWVVMHDLRDGIGGQMVLASAEITIADTRRHLAEGILPPSWIAEIHRDSCSARWAIRMKIARRMSEPNRWHRSRVYAALNAKRYRANDPNNPYSVTFLPESEKAG